MQVSLGELTAALGGELIGNAMVQISRIGALQTAQSSEITFVSNPRNAAQLAASAAGCVIVAPALRDAAVARGATIVTADPYLYFARLTQWWVAATRARAEPGVHATACVEEGAIVHASASIGAFVLIGRGARVDAGAVIGAHGVLGVDAWVGAGTRLAARVTLADACRIGQRGLVHSGAVIGADGFGFAPTGGSNGRWEKIEQLGTVVIGNDVEIGANTCIDRGALADTVLEDGVKLDNLVQIAHNVHVGAHTAFAGCAGAAGSARIGRYCTIGGAAVILGHLVIADHVHITAATVVSRSIHQAGQYSGAFPFDDNASWEKNAATLRRLHALRERVQALEKKS